MDYQVPSQLLRSRAQSSSAPALSASILCSHDGDTTNETDHVPLSGCDSSESGLCAKHLGEAGVPEDATVVPEDAAVVQNGDIRPSKWTRIFETSFAAFRLLASLLKPSNLAQASRFFMTAVRQPRLAFSSATPWLRSCSILTRGLLQRNNGLQWSPEILLATLKILLMRRPEVINDVYSIRSDDAEQAIGVALWRNAQVWEDYIDLNRGYLHDLLPCPYYPRMDSETTCLLPKLFRLHDLGLITVWSQPHEIYTEVMECVHCDGHNYEWRKKPFVDFLISHTTKRDRRVVRALLIELRLSGQVDIQFFSFDGGPAPLSSWETILLTQTRALDEDSPSTHDDWHTFSAHTHDWSVLDHSFALARAWTLTEIIYDDVVAPMNSKGLTPAGLVVAAKSWDDIDIFAIIEECLCKAREKVYADAV